MNNLLYWIRRMRLPNRKVRKAKKMEMRFLNTIFSDNKPWHYMVARSSSLETFVKAVLMSEGKHLMEK